MGHRAHFEYNGINSIDMHLHIRNDLLFTSPKADIELVDVLGRDGELAVNHNRLKGVDFAVPVDLRPPKGADVSQLASAISQWLKSDIGWHTLRFSSFPDYDYSALVIDQFDTAQTLTEFGRTVLTFRIKPYKRVAGQTLVELTDEATLHNPEQRSSNPLIEVIGEGDITLQNNGIDWLDLKGVDGRVTIDSELMSVYKDNLPQFDKMASNLTPLFPELHTGENVITVSQGTATVTIDPRWEAIV